MIFLYRDGRCKILDPEMPSDKVGRKFMKRKAEIMAVLVDCSTRLRSDTYVLVSAEHFLTKPPIRKVAFTAAFLREDESPHEGNVLHREVDIDNLYDLYGAASTIYQIAKNLDISPVLSFTTAMVLIDVAITDRQGEIHSYDMAAAGSDWEGCRDFMSEYGLICDTDTFLAEDIPKDDRLERGCYLMRYSPKEGSRKATYHFYDKKAQIMLSNHWWALAFESVRVHNSLTILEGTKGLDNIERVMRDASEAGCTVGTCITGTGLLYLCPYALAKKMRNLDSVEVYYRSRFVDSEDDPSVVHEHQSPEYMGISNPIDALYLAVFLPQYLDVQRLIYGEEPISVHVEFVTDRRYIQDGIYDFPINMSPDVGISFDLLGIFADILLNHTLQDIHEFTSDIHRFTGD